ncbi:MAG: hypothetical protein Fur0010_27090 [Bdellovibrio sp.]
MNRQNNQNQSSQFDIVTPFSEVFQLFIELIGRLVVYLGRSCWDVYLERVKKIYRNSPIKNRLVYSTKQSDCESSIGRSVNRKRPLLFSEINTAKHTGIIGSTGMGKSVCMGHLVEKSLREEKPVIIFDPKPSRSSINEFQNLCRKYGKQARIISDTVEETTFFNPLLEGDIQEISNRIMGALEWGETYYKSESQKALLEALRQIELNGNDITLEHILELLNSYHDRKSISGLHTQLFLLSNSSYSKIINCSNSESLNFKQIRLEKSCIYIGISSLGIGSVGLALNKLYFGGILNHCKEAFNGIISGLEKPLDLPISLFFDELSSTVNDQFIDLQNKCRAAGIELTYATQCPSDLDRVSPDFKRQVFENTNNLFIFNQIVPDHTEFFARTAGTTRALKKTFAIENNQRSQSGSEREVEEFIVHANIFRELRVGQCIYIQRTPKRVDLVNIKHKSKQPEPQALTSNEKVSKSIFN